MSDKGKHMIGVPQTLGETVYQMVKDKQTDTREFKALVDCFGREHLLKLYENEKKNKDRDGSV